MGSSHSLHTARVGDPASLVRARVDPQRGQGCGGREPQRAAGTPLPWPPAGPLRLPMAATGVDCCRLCPPARALHHPGPSGTWREGQEAAGTRARPQPQGALWGWVAPGLCSGEQAAGSVLRVSTRGNRGLRWGEQARSRGALGPALSSPPARLWGARGLTAVSGCATGAKALRAAPAGAGARRPQTPRPAVLLRLCRRLSRWPGAAGSDGGVGPPGDSSPACQGGLPSLPERLETRVENTGC